jgi:hypothetical protein
VPFTADEWSTGKAEIIAILKARAQSRGMITYSDLSRQLRSIAIPYDDPAMAVMLDEISTAEFKAGRGMLSVIVVHKYGDMEPGIGFFKLAESLGRKVADKTTFWVGELHTVHGYWSNRK